MKATEKQKEQMRLYYLNNDGKTRKRLHEIDLRGEKNPNWRGGLLSFTCVVCGKEKRVKKKDAEHSKYCSVKCLGVGRGAILKERAARLRIRRSCQVCGKEFSVKPSWVKKGAGKYCSNVCRRLSYKETFKHMTYDRIDANQPEIIDALEGIGATVVSLTRVKSGCPDICVGYHGVNYLFEIKVEKGRMTDAENKFHEQWRGQVLVIRSVDDALAAMGLRETTQKDAQWNSTKKHLSGQEDLSVNVDAVKLDMTPITASSTTSRKKERASTPS